MVAGIPSTGFLGVGMPDPLTLAALAGVSVFVLIAGLSLAMSRKESVADRLSRYGSRQAADAGPRAAGKESPLAAGLNRAIARGSFAANTARELARADLKLTVSEYLLISIGVVLIGFILAFLGSGSLVFGVALGGAGFYLPGLYVKFRQRGRLSAFNARLGDTITMLANSLRSGYSLPQGMDMVAREQPPPVCDEFARVVREVGLGLSTEEALANLMRRVPSPDLDLMITAINVQHEVGGNLAQILDAIGLTIRERVRIKGEINSLTAQVRYSGYVVSLMPIILSAAIYVMNPDYMGALFADVCGWSMVITALFSIFLGFIAMRKIADIEV
jgi:tight adherence protein B